MIVDDLVKVLSKIDAQALLTELDLELRVYRPARDSFWEYRKLIHPELIEGWWIKEISEIMQQFYIDLEGGKRPKVVISSPPQHGKSALVVDFITWAAGKNPDLRTIYTSFSESLGERANLHIQRIMDSDVYKKVFPKTIISPPGSSNSQSTRNRSLIEYANRAGSFRNTTVRGQITGHGLDIGCIDDPTKGREEARSLTVREKTWDWLMDDFYTRFSENAGMIVIMCMTGDTSVLMGDGSKKQLKDICVGDIVATFDNGKLTTSKVNNWKSNGIDSTYKIQTQSGKILKANERHPFLVDNNGILEWTRLKYLKVGDELVSMKDATSLPFPKEIQDFAGHAKTKKDIIKKILPQFFEKLAITANGKIKFVQKTIAINLFHAKAYAAFIIQKSIGPKEKEEEHLNQEEKQELNQDMELLFKITTEFLKSKAVNAPSAVNCQKKTLEPIGVESSVSTIVTKQEKCEDYCATTAISQLDTQKQQILRSQLHLISDFTVDPIVSINACGKEEVFDVEIDKTENFIANGIVSHNTRWHIDDPVGRLKNAFGDELKIYSYPAIAIQNEKNREVGDALFPELKSKEFLLERKNAMGTLNFESLYQQNPQIEGGEIIKGQYFRLYDTLPNIKHRMIFADTAQKTAERNDYSVFECWGVGVDGNAYLIDLIRGKWEAPELRRRAVAFWQKHKALNGPELGVLRKMKIEDKASGTGLIQDMRVEGQVLVEGIERTKDKYTRVLDVVGYIEAGKVHLPKNAPWLNDFITECESFTADDSHMHDDQIDPMIDAINEFLVVSSTLAIWQKLGR